jgi:hypothetical protein
MSRLDAPKWGMSTLESCLCMRTLGVYLMSISSSELSTRKQLLVMLSLPLLGLITYAIVTVWGAVSELRATHLSKAAVEAAIATSQLVHEQQKERGLSGGFLASKGQQFGPELGRQRELTNQKLETLKAVARRLSETPVLAEALGQPLELAIGKAGELSDFRRQVDLQAVKAAESFARYTAAISTGVDVISAVAKATNNAEIARDATAYLMFVQAKEFAGRERATLNAAFAAKTFDPESFRRFVGIVSAHDLYMRAFRTFASADASRLADATVKGNDVEEAVRMRKAAFEASPGEELDVPAGQWFKASTARIDLMKAVESKLGRADRRRTRQTGSGRGAYCGPGVAGLDLGHYRCTGIGQRDDPAPDAPPRRRTGDRRSHRPRHCRWRPDAVDRGDSGRHTEHDGRHASHAGKPA